MQRWEEERRTLKEKEERADERTTSAPQPGMHTTKLWRRSRGYVTHLLSYSDWSLEMTLIFILHRNRCLTHKQSTRGEYSKKYRINFVLASTTMGLSPLELLGIVVPLVSIAIWYPEFSNDNTNAKLAVSPFPLFSPPPFSLTGGCSSPMPSTPALFLQT